MQTLLILTRALHFASTISLAGALAFIALVAGPALWQRAGDGLRRPLLRLIWASLALGLLSGVAWLLLEAASMSGRPLTDISGEIVATVLTRTHFGSVWTWRGILALPLILCLLGAGRRAAASVAALWAALALAAAELAMLAGAGHAAAAGKGWAGDLHFYGDAVHLLAVGAWIGGLLPLALLFAEARRAPTTASAQAAPAATRRFSLMGIVAVALILATGISNSIFLVGSIPALLGTTYGHLLLLKVALFGVMVIFAAINRQWLTPLLATPAERPQTLRQLQRNALIEAALGGAVLLVLGALGTTAPALHAQPEWPLPFRLSLAAIEAVPRLRLEAIGAALVALAGLALCAYGMARPGQRTAPLLAGLLVFLATAWWPLQFMIVPAYPTSFYRPAVPFTAASILRGAQVYAGNCTACHGAGGSGDGPLARSLPVAPADLTAAHLFAHSDGDLFWWISAGIPEGGMPGLAGAVDERGRWDLINFLHARAAAAQPGALQPRVTAAPAPSAPDFTFERGGEQATLRQAVARSPVLLVLYRLPGSLPRLAQLSAAERQLAAAGLSLLAIPVDAPEAEPGGAHLPDFAATVDPEAAAAYALFTGESAPAPCEFLIDGEGFLRARWTTSPADAAALLAQLRQLERLPEQVQPPAEGHVHAH